MRTKWADTEFQQVQHNRILQSSCGSRGVLNDPRGAGNPQKTAPWRKYKKRSWREDSYPKGAVPTAAWWVQFNKVSEPIQCDMSWWQDAELEKFPEQVPLVNEESSPLSITKEARKKLRTRT